MVTLQSTVRQLKELSVRPSLTGALEVPDVRREELLATLERQASAAMFLGRAVAHAPLKPRRRPNMVTFRVPVDPGSLEGIEVLEGRFESTNERSVDAFLHPLEGIEQPRWEEPLSSWGGQGAGVESFSERVHGAQGREQAGVPGGVLQAIELAIGTGFDIVENKREALRVHENTSERIVRALTAGVS